MRRPTLFLAIAAMAAASVAFTQTGTDQPLPEARSSDNLELVAHIPDTGGTDLEFFTRELAAYEAPDGSMISEGGPFTRHFAMVGNQNTGAKIVDITAPETPYIVADLGEKDCIVGQGDVQINAEGTLAAIAYQTGGVCSIVTPDGDTKRARSGSILVDLSNPYDPIPIGNAEEPAGSHNNTLHPSGKYLYISTSSIAQGNAHVPIYDISDPANPELVTIWSAPGNSPHDIRFSADGTRAYLAGVSQYRILNTEDPENPTLIATFAPPGGSIGHDTLISPDKRFLFLGDEAGGGATFPCPGGAVYVYDLATEQAPLLLGALEADAGPITNRQLDEASPGGPGACTAHVMDLNPDGTSLTLGWYSVGTRVFDFSGLYKDGEPNPQPAGGIGPYGNAFVQTHWIVPDGANTWSAKQYKHVPGYIFSDDTKLGFYVTKILDHEVFAGE